MTLSRNNTLTSIGFDSFITKQRILSIATPDSASVKQITAAARERRELIDATHGRRVKGVIMMDSGHVILSAIPPEKIAQSKHR